MQAARRQHGCAFGKLQDARNYRPYKMVCWEEGVVTVHRSYAHQPIDPLSALRMTSVRYLGGAPPVVPLKHPPACEPEAPEGKRQKVRHCSTAGGAGELQGAHRDAVIRHAHDLIARDGFQGGGEPHLQSVKLSQGRLLVSGHFHCKLADRYHHSNRQFFVVRPDGTVSQHCHHNTCAGRSVPCTPLATDPAWFAPAGQ